jgi:hypothetical protein
MPKNKPPFRVAFREEGEFVNAYLADANTMVGAILLGSLRSQIAHRGLFEPWKALMKKTVLDMVAEMGVEIERMEEQPAPEHEKTKPT